MLFSISLYWSWAELFMDNGKKCLSEVLRIMISSPNQRWLPIGVCKVSHAQKTPRYRSKYDQSSLLGFYQLKTPMWQWYVICRLSLWGLCHTVQGPYYVSCDNAQGLCPIKPERESDSEPWPWRLDINKRQKNLRMQKLSCRIALCKYFINQGKPIINSRCLPSACRAVYKCN